jgi:hypothetical protein
MKFAITMLLVNFCILAGLSKFGNTADSLFLPHSFMVDVYNKLTPKVRLNSYLFVFVYSNSKTLHQTSHPSYKHPTLHTNTQWNALLGLSLDPELFRKMAGTMEFVAAVLMLSPIGNEVCVG